jgi:3'-5' exoribonuclease
METIKIVDLVETQEDIKIVVFTERVISQIASNGAPYLSVHMSDKTGRIEGRKWSATPADIENFVSGQIYEVIGRVNVYKNVMQFKITRFKLLSESEMQQQGIVTKDFMASAPFDLDETYNNLLSEVKKMKNDTYRTLTETILTKYKTEFTNYPAAINIHHNLVGGLLWHSSTLFKNIRSIQKNYEMFNNIDWELAECGAILHDIGKITEMNGLIADDYTLSGKLLGHISIGNELVGLTANELGIKNDDVIKLQHVILASHGKREFGSPQEPNLIEGVLISSFDSLDARIFHIDAELEKVPHEKWTARISSEEGKMFYRHFKK